MLPEAERCCHCENTVYHNKQEIKSQKSVRLPYMWPLDMVPIPITVYILGVLSTWIRRSASLAGIVDTFF